MTSDAQTRIRRAYDPELLRELGHRLSDLLAEHLQRVQSGDGPVLPWVDPPANIQQAREILESGPNELPSREQLAEHFGRLVEGMLRQGQHLHNPRYIGHQVPASIPLGGLLDAVGSVTNQVMAIYEMGPWATAVEQAMIDRLGSQIGWQPGKFAGLVTHGGSLANLTALLTARNVVLPDCWERGLAGENQPLLLVQSDAHYSVARSAGVLGIGTDQIVRIGLDDRRRMDPNQLDDQLLDLRAQNRSIIAVVACACATPIGAFDPLETVADVCRRHDVWLHVDAAHGGSAKMSAKYRHLVNGLEQADSLVWDAHKMLFVPALCAFAFYKNREHAFEAFRQDAPYLFDPSAPGMAEFDNGMRTVECTKRAAAFGLWGIWSLFGPQLFADLVDSTFDLGQTFYEKLVAAADFATIHRPQCNIVAFRYIPPAMQDATPEQLSAFQLRVRRRLIESGQFYMVSTKIDGVAALRVTIINPLTTPDHLDQLLDAIRVVGGQCMSEVSSMQQR